jgi:hypothetical protein
MPRNPPRPAPPPRSAARFPCASRPPPSPACLSYRLCLFFSPTHPGFICLPCEHAPSLHNTRILPPAIQHSFFLAFNFRFALQATCLDRLVCLRFSSQQQMCAAPFFSTPFIHALSKAPGQPSFVAFHFGISNESGPQCGLLHRLHFTTYLQVHFFPSLFSHALRTNFSSKFIYSVCVTVEICDYKTQCPLSKTLG